MSRISSELSRNSSPFFTSTSTTIVSQCFIGCCQTGLWKFSSRKRAWCPKTGVLLSAPISQLLKSCTYTKNYIAPPLSSFHSMKSSFFPVHLFTAPRSTYWLNMSASLHGRLGYQSSILLLEEPYTSSFLDSSTMAPAPSQLSKKYNKTVQSGLRIKDIFRKRLAATLHWLTFPRTSLQTNQVFKNILTLHF